MYVCMNVYVCILYISVYSIFIYLLYLRYIYLYLSIWSLSMYLSVIYVYLNIYISVFIYTYIYISIQYMCINIYIHTYNDAYIYIYISSFCTCKTLTLGTSTWMEGWWRIKDRLSWMGVCLWMKAHQCLCAHVQKVCRRESGPWN